MKTPSTRSVAAFASVALLATLIAHAARMDTRGMAAEHASADVLPNAKATRDAPAIAPRTRAGSALAAPSQDDVGDVDSFGRALVWLGVTQGNLDLAPSCPPDDGDPTTNCVALNAAPGTTAFDLDGIAHVTLPGKAANSLLCYWFSPILSVQYSNPTAASDVGMLAYSPTLTVESQVLDDPSLIDPSTGLPFDGKLVTAMTASEHFEVPLAPGQQQFERSRDSAVCIAGLLSKRALVDTYGLTDAQAKQVFKQPITISLNVSGSVRLVEEASLMFGLRIVGD